MNVNAIILAAGKGTRMKSELPKVAHKVAGKPMIDYVIDVVFKAGVNNAYLVIGHQADYIRKMTTYPNVTHVMQEEQLGTGHAVMMAEPSIDFSHESLTIVLAGDCPLVQEDTITNLIAEHQRNQSVCTVLTTKMPDPARYGRILRDHDQNFLGIREAKDCTDEQLNIQEINSGIFVFNTDALFDSLKLINTNNAQNEYYLTDVCHILKEQEKSVGAFCIDDSNQVIGINSKVELADVSKIVYKKRAKSYMEKGVTIIDPESTFIDDDVEVGKECIIYPFSMIAAGSKLGDFCQIGPHSFINGQEVSAHTRVSPFHK